jgi:hypothetical protein
MFTMRDSRGARRCARVMTLLVMVASLTMLVTPVAAMWLPTVAAGNVRAAGRSVERGPWCAHLVFAPALEAHLGPLGNVVGGPPADTCERSAQPPTLSGSTMRAFRRRVKLENGGEIGAGYLGYSVALAADGNTALVGGYEDNDGVGAAWMFARSRSTWTQLGLKLKPRRAMRDYGGFGLSVALSSDGHTALIGGTTGVAWVFTRTSSTSIKQSAKLTPRVVGEGQRFLSLEHVALSENGNVALIGGTTPQGAAAAWVFTRSGATWTQQGAELIPRGANRAISPSIGDGCPVALSSDGSTALIGSSVGGAAWVFARRGGDLDSARPELSGP